MSDDSDLVHTVWNILLTAGAGAIGWVVKRMADALDTKADRRELDELRRDVRERQASQDSRERDRDVEHGKLMAMLDQWRRRNGWGPKDEE